ncbi:MAG: peptidase and in kexin sedolisin [Acidobacteriaceae bacterium]|nr:peptidase and in kexin sedolisin [Acidobacteriaceae bacterium]
MSIYLSSCSARSAHTSSFYGSLFFVLLLAALLASPASAQQTEWPKDGSADLVALRGSTSPAERKLSFNLLLISRAARHARVGSFTPSLDPNSMNPDGTVNVEVIAYLSPSLVASPVMAEVLRVNGAIPLSAYISDHLQVRLSKAQLLDLAANPNVLTIREVPRTTVATSLAAVNHLSAPARATPR